MKVLLLILMLAMSCHLALGLGPAHSEGWDSILIELRLPRVLGALVVGAGLALAGVGMQALLRNPLADPYILGLSSGASIGAALTLLGWTELPVELGACLGATCATLLVFSLARDASGLVPSTRLILAGVAVASVLSSLGSFLLQIAPREASLRGALYFGAGGFTGVGLQQVLWSSLAVSAVFLLAWSKAWQLDRLLLGEDMAATLGVDPARLRIGLLLGCSALTGLLVALAGPVGFIGLVAPHLGRLWVGPSHRKLLPVACALGALLLLWADTVGRTVLVPREIPAGLMTALCGGPFFLALLARRRYGFGGPA